MPMEIHTLATQITLVYATPDWLPLHLFIDVITPCHAERY